ncbi:hypothetical protein [Tenacibaculum jejuense]|uniref:hypothetical protein n=1 Tax=Tenacibaculum jejuense TaxID=584609 RepID=UPI000BA37429|nr:hypothetical protein [Tenacibaculum jejuense]
MLKNILKQKGVKKLNNKSLTRINGGYQEYYCWTSSGRTYTSNIDISSSSTHCVPIVEVVAERVKE